MMKKTMMGVVLLFCTLANSAFAGNIGYIWMPSRSLAYDVINYADPESEYILKADIKKGLPDINSIIRIEAKNRMYFDLSLIQDISKKFLSLVKEENCPHLQGAFSYFMLNQDKKCSIDSVLEQISKEWSYEDEFYYTLKSPIKAKVLGYVEFKAGVFVLIEQKELLREEKKDK